MRAILFIMIHFVKYVGGNLVANAKNCKFAAFPLAGRQDWCTEVSEYRMRSSPGWSVARVVWAAACVAYAFDERRGIIK